MIGSNAVPALVTLQIIDGHQGKSEALVVRSIAFQLIVEETCSTPDVVTVMYLLLISLFMFIFLVIYVFCF